LDRQFSECGCDVVVNVVVVGREIKYDYLRTIYPCVRACARHIGLSIISKSDDDFHGPKRFKLISHEAAVTTSGDGCRRPCSNGRMVSGDFTSRTTIYFQSKNCFSCDHVVVRTFVSNPAFWGEFYFARFLFV